MTLRARGLAWAIALAVLLFAVAVTPLALARGPWVRLLLSTSQPGLASGLDPAARTALLRRAEAARRLSDPFQLDTRQAAAALRADGFTAAEIEHLFDVRRVFFLALWIALLAPVLAGGLVVLTPTGERVRAVRAAAARAAAAGAVVAGAAAALGVVAFGTLFGTFHSAFFAAGTWQFPEGSLLVETFPERFWALAAAMWAIGWVGLTGAVWIGASLAAEVALPREGGGGSATQ